MAINVAVYGETAETTRNITVEFVADILATGVTSDLQRDYYMRVTTSATDTDGNTIPPRIVQGLSDLALIDRQRITGSAADYNDITQLARDYLYDTIHGHAAGLHGSSASEQKGIQF